MPPIGKDLCPDRTRDGCKQAQTPGNRTHSSALFPKHDRANCCHNQKLRYPSSAIRASTQRASRWFCNSIQYISQDYSCANDPPLPHPYPSDSNQSTDHGHWFDPLKYQAQYPFQSSALTTPPHYIKRQYSRLHRVLSLPMPYQFLGRYRAPSHPNNGFPNACECATLPLPPPMQPPHSS